VTTASSRRATTAQRTGVHNISHRLKVTARPGPAGYLRQGSLSSRPSPCQLTAPQNGLTGDACATATSTSRERMAVRKGHRAPDQQVVPTDEKRAAYSGLFAAGTTNSRIFNFSASAANRPGFERLRLTRRAGGSGRPVAQSVSRTCGRASDSLWASFSTCRHSNHSPLSLC
jgi:hypothetical protein